MTKRSYIYHKHKFVKRVRSLAYWSLVYSLTAVIIGFSFWYIICYFWFPGKVMAFSWVTPEAEESAKPSFRAVMSITPTPTQIPSPTPTLEPEQVKVEKIVREVFGDKADEAIKVFKCESGLRSKCNDGTNKNGTVDCGPAQINSQAHQVARKWLLNPEINILIAKQIYTEQHGWSAWRSSRKCHGLD